MTHQPSRDIERKKPGARMIRRVAQARARRDERSARDKFLAASLDLFAERNFASVTIKDIAKALNVNTALIYYYFDSKTDLFRATIEYAVAGAFENVRALDDRSAAPPAIIAAWLAPVAWHSPSVPVEPAPHGRRGAGTRRPAAPRHCGRAPSPPTPRPGRCRRAASTTTGPDPTAWRGIDVRSR